MAGLGGKNWGFQEEVTSSDVNGFLADQVVMKFADSTTRTAGFGGAGEPTLAAGMVSYLDDTKTLSVYDGSNWVVFANANQTPFSSFTSYTPVLTAATTNPTLGSGAVTTGAYSQFGKLVAYRFFISFGTSGVSAGSGAYRISLPVTASTTLGAGALTLGSLFIFDSSTNNAHTGLMGNVSNGTYLSDIYYAQGGVLAAMSNSAPWTWAASDQIRGFIIYEAAG